jgi:acyl-CoA thioesterase-1
MMRLMIAITFVLFSSATPAKTLVVLGDSASAGYGLPQDKSWVALLVARVQKEKLDYTVANASISGETTLGGANRIEAVLKQHRPAIVILALGGNDGLRGQNIDTMRRNLEKIIIACEKANARVVLVGIRLPPNYGSAYVDKFHATYVDLAKQRKLALAPYLFEGFGDKPDWFQPDGIHPAIKAQPLMMETVWKALEPLLPSAAASKK